MKNPNFTFKSSYSSIKFFPYAVYTLIVFLLFTQLIQSQTKLDASSFTNSNHKIGINDLKWNMRFSDKSNSDLMFTELSIGPSVQITQPNCIQNTGTIKITAPLDPNFSYSIDGSSYQSGAIFTHLTPGNYHVTTKDNIGVVSDITWIAINAPPSNCNADIFHTTEDCDDFKNGGDSSRLDQLCYTINSNKIFNVTPGQFFYFTSLVAPSTSFTITVNQTSNITNFPLFSVNKDQIILWSDTCTKFVTGTEVSNGQVEINVTNAVVGKTYVLSVKYDSKSIIGNTVTGEPIPEYSFNTLINGILVNNSTTSIFMYPNNCVSQGLASIGDLVWNDLDNDGIQDEFEPGIITTVRLYTCSNQLVATTTSAENGSYSFKDLQPGTYYLQFDLPQNFFFSPKDQGTDDTKDNDVDVITGKTNCITLLAGENNTTIDCGIDPPVSLGDFVWNDLNGDGIQDVGETGIANVVVKLYDCNESLITSTTTNSEGYYLFETIPPGSYYVEFTKPEGYEFSPKDQGGIESTDSDADPTTGRSVCQTLIFGQTDTWNDAGMYIPASIGNFVWKDLNGNGIQDIDEPGFSNITVKLYTCGDVLIGSKTTATDGSYLFEHLSPGSYYIQVDLPLGYKFSPSNIGSNNTIDSDIDPTSYKSTCVSLLSGDINTIIDAGIECVPPVAPSFTLIQPSCTLATGTITVTEPLGSDLVYSIDGINFQSDVAFSGIASGSYQITVKNTYSCVSDPVSAVLDPQPPTPVAATVSIIQPSCTLATGTITVTEPLGSDLVYSIDGTNFQSDVAFSGIASGSYQVTVKNTYSCVSDPFSAVLDPQPPTPVAATVSIIQPNCIVPTGTITVNSPLDNSFTYSLDNVNYQSGTIFSYKLPGSYNITVKNLYGCISVPTIAEVKPQPNCGANIFNTTTTCDDFKYAVTGKLHDRLCYTIKSNKVFNVTPGMFFYYTLIKAPASSFTIYVDQSVNLSSFKLFAVQKDQIILWNDACVKFMVGRETTTGQVQINVTGASIGKIYILNVKYDSKSIIGGAISGSPIPYFTFSSRINTSPAPNSTISVSMYPNNCNLPGAANLNVSSSHAMELETLESNLQLYPNPNTGTFTLMIKGFETGKALIHIVDIYGNILLVKEAVLINRTTLLPLSLPGEITNGIYFVQVSQGSQKKTIRLLKQ